MGMFTALALLLASLAVAAARPEGQEAGPDEVVRIETNLVTVPVIATDRQGRYVSDLRRENFRLYEDRVKQELAYFAAVE